MASVIAIEPMGFSSMQTDYLERGEVATGRGCDVFAELTGIFLTLPAGVVICNFRQALRNSVSAPVASPRQGLFLFQGHSHESRFD
jgi:hypothetical protein